MTTLFTTNKNQSSLPRKADSAWPTTPKKPAPMKKNTLRRDQILMKHSATMPANWSKNTPSSHASLLNLQNSPNPRRRRKDTDNEKPKNNNPWPSWNTNNTKQMAGGILTARLEKCLASNIGKEKELIQLIKATGNAHLNDSVPIVIVITHTIRAAVWAAMRCRLILCLLDPITSIKPSHILLFPWESTNL